MGTAESSRGRRERSPKQEYLDQEQQREKGEVS
jgi:hypothetical protein